MNNSTKITISAIRRNFACAVESRQLYRERLEMARKYRLEGDRKLAMLCQSLAAGYRQLAIDSNRNAIWWIKKL